ncbi:MULTISPECIES: hypothetical protein [Streptomyces]|uniref:PknH-like extracellular domain-containing protein n=1 Tax=Streptomyces chartreusis NRRL 3882 TaxID=1079985 RepID=A0A2N9B4C7_STRCX|nr:MULTISPECIES: hypothetical protein [Streptomyces]MYS95652.1 hypothetical protein [Streptomyces sp. SID5464]SOR78191.1 hypothetical protein SCNRRL3882_1659 [Streptomyces chartreusis NRRL 3882]
MPMRTRAGALTALTVAALAAGTVLTAPPAGAAPKASPRFLSASELPPHPTSGWTAGPVTDGFPEELGSCLAELPGYDYRHRAFRTELETSAVQVTVVTGSAAKAKALAKRFDDAVRTCADRIEESSPDVRAEGRDYGSLPVEEGARVRGLHTETSWGATDIALLSVGRDGRTVTVVEWGQMGDFDDAPVAAFKKTTTTAVDKLY